MKDNFHSTTVLLVKRDRQIAIGADGQVTLQNTVIKQKARKIRLLYNQQVLAGFAGSTSDAFSLFQLFEAKLEEYNGNISRAAVELAREWRTDKILRRLEALLIVANHEKSFLISGSGDIIEPDNDILAIGSGGPYAQAAAIALLQNTTFSAEEIVRKSLEIAADICIYTNKNFVIEVLTNA